VKLELLPEALLEFHESIAYYEEQDPGLGRRFFTAIVSTIELAAENPRLGSPLPPPAIGVRKFVVKRFPYVVLVAHVGIVGKVVAITHTSRRPGYWLDRIQ